MINPSGRERRIQWKHMIYRMKMLDLRSSKPVGFGSMLDATVDIPLDLEGNKKKLCAPIVQLVPPLMCLHIMTGCHYDRCSSLMDNWRIKTGASLPTPSLHIFISPRSTSLSKRAAFSLQMVIFVVAREVGAYVGAHVFAGGLLEEF